MTTPLLAAFDQQAAWCRQGGAPFTARVVSTSRAWLAADAGAHDSIAAISRDPLGAAVALRWVGGLHHLALRGLAPWRDLWPPARNAGEAAEAGAAGAADDAALAAAVAAAWRDERDAMLAALARPPQTNEVMRSAALLPGLLHVAQACGGLPLRLLEVGASAGLNLWCDRWRYEPDGWAWGSAGAGLVLRARWAGAPPPLQARLAIAHRAGCDANPVDLSQPGEALRLASFVWPDQPERLQRLRTAAALAAGWIAAEGASIEALPAADFVARELAAPCEGHATVLMHSVVWQYIDEAERAAITAAVLAAGARATASAPLAWLRFEPPAPDVTMELRCRLWPGGSDRLLARCHPHGASVEWLAAP